MTVKLHKHLLNKGSALILNGEKGLTDSDLAQLLEFTEDQREALTVVVLSNTNVTGDCLKYLAGLPRLRELCLNGTRIADGDSFELFGENLEVVNFDSTGFGDSGVARLKRASNLRVVSLRDTKVTNRGVYLLSTFPQLREYYVEESGISTYAKRRVDNAIELADADFAWMLRPVGYQVQMMARRSMRWASYPV